MKMQKKIGRPTISIKDSEIKVRIDDETRRMLDYCTKTTQMSKSEVVRKGITMIYKEKKGETLK